MKLKHIIEAQQFNLETLTELFTLAKKMEEVGTTNDLRGKVVATLFYEPSTRTRLSFESAVLKLGGKCIGTENAKEFSSAAKGESLEDTIRIIAGYADLIILRYPKIGGAERAKNASTVPIINAGDGAGQHPTQSLIDLYTIKKCFGRLEGLNIGMVGDLANSRTVRSLCYFLAKHFPGNKIFLISPPETKMNNDVTEYLNKYGVIWKETDSLVENLSELDVVYQTRVQAERFNGNQTLIQKAKKASRNFIITKEIVSQMKRDAIIMHPLPRVDEISYEVDQDPRVKYFEQAKNGLYVRMALLKMILG